MPAGAAKLAHPVEHEPLPRFDTVQQDGQLHDVTSIERFYTAARSGMLPSVSWVEPNDRVSEHPPNPITAGQAFVTIFLAWDDWGGF